MSLHWVIVLTCRSEYLVNFVNEFLSLIANWEKMPVSDIVPVYIDDFVHKRILSRIYPVKSDSNTHMCQNVIVSAPTVKIRRPSVPNSSLKLKPME